MALVAVYEVDACAYYSAKDGDNQENTTYESGDPEGDSEVISHVKRNCVFVSVRTLTGCQLLAGTAT